MKIKRLNLFLFGFVLCQNVYSLTCPNRKSKESDKYDIQGRFEKFSKAVRGLSVVNVHEKTLPKKDEKYNYTVIPCTQEADGAAVTQKDMETGTISILGKASKGVLVGGVDWIMALYRGGDKYDNHCDKQERESWLLIQCEEGSRKMELRVIEEYRWTSGEKDTGVCYYLLEVNHPAACSSEDVRRTKMSKLSGGTIFCIVFASLLLAYAIFGLLYMRFVAGAKGFEQIPHYSFWRELGNLAADGCDFVCRRPNHPANTYKGMADALNIDSSDDEKDDQLLPM